MTDQRSPSSPPAPVPMPADSSAATAYRVTLPEFEGPLDLLLHLCQTHELDILNISIAFIAEKYIEYLELMQNMSVEVAADYLVMAAHLAYLKSRELVPAPEPVETTEEGEELVDPREELIRRLLEYQKYKHAAENLGNRPIEGRNVFVRGAVLEPPGEAGLAEHSVWKLIEHWAGMMKKAKPQYTHDVVVDRMSITDRINQIVDLLTAGKGMVRFEDLLGQDLPPAELRHKVVISLLAVLELARLRVIRILQQIETGSFFLAQTDNADLEGARHLQVTSAKQEEPEEDAADEASGAGATAASESPVAAAAAPSPEDAFSDEALDDETAADDAALAEPHSPLEEGATAAIIASAEDAALEAAEAAAEAAEAFPDDQEAEPAAEVATEAALSTESASDAATESELPTDEAREAVEASAEQVPAETIAPADESVAEPTADTAPELHDEPVAEPTIVETAPELYDEPVTEPAADVVYPTPEPAAEPLPDLHEEFLAEAVAEQSTDVAPALQDELPAKPTADATPAVAEPAVEPPPVIDSEPTTTPADAQGPAEQFANDSVRQGQQDGVISAPFPAPAPESEEPIHGQAQEEQESSEK